MMDRLYQFARRHARNMLRGRSVLRARGYRAVFLCAGGTLSTDAEHVLADLRGFACGNKTTFAADPYQAARLAGRREVWLRITQHLALDEDQVVKLMEIDDGL